MKMLMDGGSGLNVLYANMLDHKGIPKKCLYPKGAPFFRIIYVVQVVPLRSIQLLIMIGDPTSF